MNALILESAVLSVTLLSVSVLTVPLLPAVFWDNLLQAVKEVKAITVQPINKYFFNLIITRKAIYGYFSVFHHSTILYPASPSIFKALS